jgi:hypothetical protein
VKRGPVLRVAQVIKVFRLVQTILVAEVHLFLYQPTLLGGKLKKEEDKMWK